MRFLLDPRPECPAGFALHYIESEPLSEAIGAKWIAGQPTF